MKDTDTLFNDFNASIGFDSRLYKYDIKGSIAHAEMLEACGILTADESKLITDGLNKILENLEFGKLEIDFGCEDIHTWVEKLLTDMIGPAGKKLHTARSRNDQVALDLKMYVKDEINEIANHLENLEKTIVSLSKDNINTIMPGYTHLQPAQPVTLAHHLMAYYEMFRRDMGRLSDCFKRTDTMPLGACALAGTTYNIDRNLVAERLGFTDITYNSMDSVSDRDFAIELLGSISIIMMHLSRFCEEIILWCSPQFSFAELDDSYSTGSSIMPQKKNPDAVELIRGKAGRTYGNLFGLLTVMKGIPLSYNKDMQEDKELTFDSVDTVKICISVFSSMLASLKIKKANMKKACTRGFINATDAADYLTKKGVPFRESHEIVGRLVLYCLEKGKILEDMDLEEYTAISSVFDRDIYDAIDIDGCVEKRTTLGGPASAMVLKEIEKACNYIDCTDK